MRVVVERRRVLQLAGAPGVEQPSVLHHAGADEAEGARRGASQSGRSNAIAASASAAIISPFQSTSTLSSQPGRTRPLA